MEINLNNYEGFFLDYKEGSLSAEQEKELFLFLEQNPRLYEELHAFENVTIDELIKPSFEKKDSLKKTEFSNEVLIAFAEGVLPDEKKIEIEKLAGENKAFKKELTYYVAAHVTPDLSEHFSNKESLKRGRVIRLYPNKNILRVAAAVLLLAGLFFIASKFVNTENKDQNARAEVKSGVPSPQSLIPGQSQGEDRKKSNENVASDIETKLATTNSMRKEIKIKRRVVKDQSDAPEKELQLPTKNADESLIVQENISPAKNENPSENKLVTNENSALTNEAATTSFFNSSDETEDAPAKNVVASATPKKKTFFQRVAKVAKDANVLGLKGVNSSEEEKSSTLTIGGLVFSESKSAE